jgi:hypothetical protein
MSQLSGTESVQRSGTDMPRTPTPNKSASFLATTGTPIFPSPSYSPLASSPVTPSQAPALPFSPNPLFTTPVSPIPPLQSPTPALLTADTIFAIPTTPVTPLTTHRLGAQEGTPASTAVYSPGTPVLTPLSVSSVSSITSGVSTFSNVDEIPPVRLVVISKDTRITIVEKPSEEAVATQAMADNQDSMHVSPTATTSASLPSTKTVAWDMIGGLDRELEMIREVVEGALVHPERFHKFGVPAPKGLLLFGPPGTGKTLIARAVASELNVPVFSISGPEIVGAYYGESEKKLREIFENARSAAPAVIVLDEVDAIAPRRDKVQMEGDKRLVGCLLAQIDSIGLGDTDDGGDTMCNPLSSKGDLENCSKRKSSQVVVIAATNAADALDPAVRRPGRLDREIEIGAYNDFELTQGSN